MTTPPPPRRGAPTLPNFQSPKDSRTVWFSRRGCVVWHESGRRDALVGGALVGSFEKRDTVARNLLLVQLAADDSLVLEDLAHAFGVTSETVRLLRRVYEKDGAIGIVERRRGSRGPWKVTKAVRERVAACFEKGLSIGATRKELKDLLVPATLRKLRREWEEERARQAEALSRRPVQQSLALGNEAGEVPQVLPNVTEVPEQSAQPQPSTEVPAQPKAEASATPVEAAGRLEADGVESGYVLRSSQGSGAESPIRDGRELAVIGPESRRNVQFLGSWLLLAMTARLGLHEAVAERAATASAARALRVAVDAVAIALGIGEGCVEGVRRLAHKTVDTLLCAVRAPSPEWVRTMFGRIAANGGGALVQAAVSGGLIRAAARGVETPAVYYIDNHVRRYTGKRRLLRGWRMQEKRAVPGGTDLHVHDADGRPLYRLPTAMHDSLGKLLLPIAALLRLVLGEQQRILLAFDRAASYAELLSELRDANFEFVAYEKKPYPTLPQACFRRSFILGDERIFWFEMRKNLGRGRGRIRRIALRLPDGHQINLLAHSRASAAELAAIMSGRWCQENAFHHGARRWGLNQLDSRSFTPFPEDVVIPSPLRRRLDYSIDILREVEGRLRRKLARSPQPDVRAALEKELSKNLKQQQRLEARRPSLDTHCTVKQAGLHGTLMFHDEDYKTVIDTIRTACVNAEADLAAELAATSRRPREAKRLLQNVFSAPGHVRVHSDFIDVSLDVAARQDELAPIQNLLRVDTEWKLALPGDSLARPLRFRAQN